MLHFSSNKINLLIQKRATNGPRRAKKFLQTCTNCADLDLPAHAQSFNRNFALRLYILYEAMILLADNEGPDQTARMRSLIWAFAVRTCPEGTFLLGAAQVLCI